MQLNNSWGFKDPQLLKKRITKGTEFITMEK